VGGLVVLPCLIMFIQVVAQQVLGAVNLRLVAAWVVEDNHRRVVVAIRRQPVPLALQARLPLVG